MRQRTSQKARRYFTSVFCFISFILILLTWTAIDALGAQEFKTPGSGALTRKTSPYGEKGKERDMVEEDKLTEEEGRCLLSVARETIHQRLFSSERQDLPDSQVSPKFSEKRGTFVTLTIDGGLRGCIGHIIPQEPLLEGIRINAINAAFQDPRFRPLSRKEWERVKIEISILTTPEALTYSDAEDLLDKLRPGIHGVIIKKGFHQATFLPQVWEQLPDKKEFLTHLCMKAGLERDAWKKEKLEVSTYQVQAFEEH
jgi:AmmeMemoRadiSam system protein A